MANINKALLFVNGEPPSVLPTELAAYRIIACTDGAYHNYLQNSVIIPHYLIGDLDSVQDKPICQQINIIHTPDQNKTDFEKALVFLMTKNIQHIDIYGASGHASDHFLGNLSVALQYKDRLTLTFYDDYNRFFFVSPKTTLTHVKGKTISLIPFGDVIGVTLTGFAYPLVNAHLYFGGQTSLRNYALTDKVEIDFEQGHLLVFISN